MVDQREGLAVSSEQKPKESRVALVLRCGWALLIVWLVIGWLLSMFVFVTFQASR
jgi:hypothetical protein